MRKNSHRDEKKVSLLREKYFVRRKPYDANRYQKS